MGWLGWGWNPAERGKKGEYIIHLAADIRRLCEEEPLQAFIPDDFDKHVQPEKFSIDQLNHGDLIFATDDPKPDDAQVDDVGHDQQPVSQNLHASSDNNFQSEPKPNATSFTNESSPLPSSTLESKVTFADPPHESDKLKVINDRELRDVSDLDVCHLPNGKLRQMIYEAQRDKKDFDKILSFASAGGGPHNCKKKKKKKKKKHVICDPNGEQQKKVPS